MKIALSCSYVVSQGHPQFPRKTCPRLGQGPESTRAEAKAQSFIVR